MRRAVPPTVGTACFLAGALTGAATVYLFDPARGRRRRRVLRDRLARGGRTAVPLGWTHPITLAGAALGVVALALIAAVATGRAAFLVPLTSFGGSATPTTAAAERAAIIVLAGLMLLKWVVGLAKYAA